MINRVIKAFGSLRLTLCLILSLSLTFLLGLWIPQKVLLRRELYLQWKEAAPILVAALDTLGLTDIYTSPITLTLWVLFFLNLSLVMWQKVPIIRAKISIPANGYLIAGAHPGPCRASIRVSSRADFAAISSAFSGAGYRVYGTFEQFIAVRNRFSPAATLLFHMSFFLILLGGLFTAYTRFAGTVDLAEGEQFMGEIARYNPVPRFPKIGQAPNVQFTVERINPGVEQDTPVSLGVTLLDMSGDRHETEINRPYKSDDTSIVIQDLGVAPLFVLQDRQGRELDGAYVKLDVLKGKRDAFSLSGIEFSVDFFPDYVFARDGTEGTRSEEVKNPVFRLHIQRGTAFLGRRTIRPGEKVLFGDRQLILKDMRYWVRFYVIKERGLGILYTGFAMATIALIWRLAFYRREIMGSAQKIEGDTVLDIRGRAEFYGALFEDEFLRLQRNLEALGN